MFVYPHKMVIKTCGTTTLLLALPRILDIAKDICGFEKVWRVFYSRKAFMFPDRQVGPHKSWENEVAFLDQYFGKFPKPKPKHPTPPPKKILINFLIKNR
jgi:S-adenosylmethionine decarboxylase